MTLMMELDNAVKIAVEIAELNLTFLISCKTLVVLKISVPSEKLSSQGSFE